MSTQFDEAVKLVPMVGVLLSILAFLASLRKDRKLRLKEYADRVRRSTALVVARADRWKHLSLGLFQDIQVPITDTDIILVKERDVRRADDFFWRELFIAQRTIANRLADEQIEIAYADLFGYDAKIHELFGALIQRLRTTDRRAFVALLKRTQDDILGSYDESGVYVSTVLGNKLRATTKQLSSWCSDLMEAALVEFRKEMVKIVEASDETIVRRRIAIRTPAEVFAGFHEIADPPIVKDMAGSVVGISSQEPRENFPASPAHELSVNQAGIQFQAIDKSGPASAGEVRVQRHPPERQPYLSRDPDPLDDCPPPAPNSDYFPPSRGDFGEDEL